MSSSISSVDISSNSVLEMDLHQLLSLQTILLNRLAQLISLNQLSCVESVPLTSPGKYCLYHLHCKHCTEECRVIKRLISREQATCQVNHTNVGVPAQVRRKRYRRTASKSISKSKDAVQRTYAAIVQDNQPSSSAQDHQFPPPQLLVNRSPVTAAGAKGKFSTPKRVVKHKQSRGGKWYQQRNKRALNPCVSSSNQPAAQVDIRRGPPARPPTVRHVQLMPPAAASDDQLVHPPAPVTTLPSISVEPTQSHEDRQESATALLKVLHREPLKEPLEEPDVTSTQVSSTAPCSQVEASASESQCPEVQPTTAIAPSSVCVEKVPAATSMSSAVDSVATSESVSDSQIEACWEHYMGSTEKIERLRQALAEWTRRNTEPESYRRASSQFCL